jgi:hypothetical protein
MPKRFINREGKYDERLIAASVAELTDSMERIFHTLYGNGSPGWDEMLRNIDTEQKKAAIERQEIKQVLKEYQPMQTFYKVGIWVISILGSAILLLIWNFITGQATITFK